MVCERLRLETKEPDLAAWKAMVERVVHPKQKVRIAVVGKYTDLHDAYKSVQEALIHGGIANDAGVEIPGWRSDQFTESGGGGTAAERYRRVAGARRVRDAGH